MKEVMAGKLNFAPDEGARAKAVADNIAQGPFGALF
jgi:hypothetical protein